MLTLLRLLRMKSDLPGPHARASITIQQLYDGRYGFISFTVNMCGRRRLYTPLYATYLPFRVSHDGADHGGQRSYVTSKRTKQTKHATKRTERL